MLITKLPKWAQLTLWVIAVVGIIWHTDDILRAGMNTDSNVAYELYEMKQNAWIWWEQTKYKLSGRQDDYGPY